MTTDRATRSPAADPAAIARIVEEDIVLGLLHPRERLVEDDLMRRFDAKRHVARRAIDELVTLGLAVKVRNVGAQVRSYTRQQIADLYEVRDLLESSCAAAIQLPVDADALDALRTVQARHDAAVDLADLRTAFRANQEFHQQLYGLAGNRALVEAVNTYAQRTHVARFVTLTDPAELASARDQHRQMIDALAAGARDALVALCRDHLQPSLEAYLRVVAED